MPTSGDRAGGYVGLSPVRRAGRIPRGRQRGDGLGRNGIDGVATTKIAVARPSSRRRIAVWPRGFGGSRALELRVRCSAHSASRAGRRTPSAWPRRCLHASPSRLLTPSRRERAHCGLRDDWEMQGERGGGEGEGRGKGEGGRSCCLFFTFGFGCQFHFWRVLGARRGAGPGRGRSRRRR